MMSEVRKMGRGGIEREGFDEGGQTERGEIEGDGVCWVHEMSMELP